MGVTTRVGLFVSIFFSAKSLKKGFTLLSLTQTVILNQLQYQLQYKITDYYLDAVLAPLLRGVGGVFFQKHVAQKILDDDNSNKFNNN